MRSYEAARKYFGLLEFLSWCVIVAGVLAALVGVGAGSQANIFGARSNGLAILGALPGLRIAFLGFLGLVGVQIGRAGVDSAEYGQQALQVAREQLEISRQSLKLQNGARSTGFAEAVAKDTTGSLKAELASSEPSYADGSMDIKERSGDFDSNGLAEAKVGLIEHQGRQIKVIDGKFQFAKMSFDTLPKARQYIDQLGVNPNAKIE